VGTNPAKLPATFSQPGPALILDAAIVLFGSLAGGFVSGLAGFGTGLVALGIWLHAMDPKLAATLVLFCSVISQVQTIPNVWHAIDRRRVGPFIVGGIVGVPLGAMLVAYLAPEAFRLSVGVLLVTFSLFMLSGGPRRKLAWGGWLADTGIGFGGGVMGGLAGLSGPLPIIWATLRAWTRDERRGVFQAYNLAVLFTALLAHVAAGLFTAELVRLALIALPGTLSGAFLGARLYRRLSDRRFDQLVLSLLALSGVVLVWTSLVG
jgi:uncharacterized membrane protein YfcA